jgi:hypothetical protein
MRRVFLIFTLFAMIVSMTVSATHDHASVDSPSEISISVDLDDSGDHNHLGSKDCDIACGGCCIHHVMNNSNQITSLPSSAKDRLQVPHASIFVSDFIYGLKRPPQIINL